jgi:hypothetical protein
MSGRVSRTLAVVLGSALLPIFTNLASASLPQSLQRYTWVSWLIIPALLIPMVLFDLNRGHPAAAPLMAEDILPLRSPEEPANAAAHAYRNRRFLEAFQHYVIAVDRLHDFYIFDQMKNRQPAVKDAWIVEGLTASLGAALAMDPQADVANGVDEAAARLQDISDAATRAGLNPRVYVQGLIDLQRYMS